jgi:hypothetical protein
MARFWMGLAKRLKSGILRRMYTTNPSEEIAIAMRISDNGLLSLLCTLDVFLDGR